MDFSKWVTVWDQFYVLNFTSLRVLFWTDLACCQRWHHGQPCLQHWREPPNGSMLPPPATVTAQSLYLVGYLTFGPLPVIWVLASLVSCLILTVLLNCQISNAPIVAHLLQRILCWSKFMTILDRTVCLRSGQVNFPMRACSMWTGVLSVAISPSIVWQIESISCEILCFFSGLVFLDLKTVLSWKQHWVSWLQDWTVLWIHRVPWINSSGVLIGSEPLSAFVVYFPLPLNHSFFRQAFTYVENFASVVPHLQAAITLCRILVCFEAKSESDDLIKKICEMSESMLKRKWHHHPQEKNQQINEQLQILLK